MTRSVTGPDGECACFGWTDKPPLITPETRGSGAAALDLFDQHPDIQAVMLDFAMPGMNGGKVARELAVRRPGLPILFATGYADIETLAATAEDRVFR